MVDCPKTRVYGQSTVQIQFITLCSLKLSVRLHSGGLISHVALVSTRLCSVSQFRLFSKPHTDTHVCKHTHAYTHSWQFFKYIFNVGFHLMSHSWLLPTQTCAKYIAEQPNIERRGDRMCFQCGYTWRHSVSCVQDGVSRWGDDCKVTCVWWEFLHQ